MFRKQLLFQRRNVGQNFCLLAAPIFFCLLLLIIQAIVRTGTSCLFFIPSQLKPHL